MLSERIRRRLDEFLCDHCAAPVKIGAVSVVVEKSGGRYCSVRCAGHDWEHDGQRVAKPVPVLFQADHPSLF